MGAMASTAKPWELDLTEDPSDPRVQLQRDAKETDGLLREIDTGKVDDTSEHCDFTLGMKPFLTKLEGNFGYKLLWLLFGAQFLVKGFAFGLIGKAEPYMYKMHHVPAGQMQVYQGVTALPWAMKPIIGLVSDIFPIGGYNKAPYMLATSAVAMIGYFCVGTISSAAMPVTLLVICFICIQLQASTADLLSEAKYAEKMNEHPTQGPSLMTYVWFGMQIGGLCAVLLSGVIIARSGAQLVYLVALIPASAILVPVYLNYMEETALTSGQATEKYNKFMEQRETIWLCGIMLFGTCTLVVTGLTSGPGDHHITAVVSLLIAFVVIVGFSVLLSPTIAKFNAFSLIQTSLSLSLGGASFYFYTDTPDQYPEGPHFSPFFYNSVLGVVTSIVSLFGIWCYQRYMTTWKYRNILVCTNLAYSIFALPDIVLFTRYNLTLGIPDHVFMMGSSVAQSVIFQWQWMPQVVILSYLCPKGMEATMYALLAGCHNLGNTIAANCGAVMLDYLGCTPSGQVNESSKFDNLWKASVLSTILPLFTILALFWLIPDVRQNERIIDDSYGSATRGSLWRRWTGRDLD